MIVNSEEEKTGSNTDDEKQKFCTTTAFPQSAHDIIIIKESENNYSEAKWGSGVLIGPDIVLTSAHNVYDDSKPIKKRYPYIKIIPGVNGDEVPFGEIDVEDVFAPDSYVYHVGRD